MPRKSWPKRASTRYALLGALFGAVFPIAAVILVYVVDANVVILVAIIATAPLILAFSARLLGVQEERMRASNIELENRVNQRTRSIQSLLDVTGDGFLSFGPDYMVRAEYSRACEVIFGSEIAGKRLPDLLYVDEQSRQDFTDGLDLYFGGKARPEVIFDLLDTEVTVGERVIELDFRAIDDTTVMCSLSDSTGQKQLEAQVEEQERRRSLILRVVSNRAHFASFVEEAEALFQVLESASRGEGEIAMDSEELLMMLHTFKGNANFLGFSRSGTVSHDVEDQLAALEILDSDFDFSSEVFVLKRQFYDELNIVTDTLGKQWLEDIETVNVPSRYIRKVEQYVRNRYSADSQLVQALEGFRRVPLSSLFSRFPDLINDIATRRGRRTQRVEIHGGDFKVLPERFEPVVNSLTHVARNMIDHGIESPAEREMKGKDPAGEIRIELRDTGEMVEIVMADDGQGIPTTAIEQRGRAQGLIAEGDEVSRRDLLAMIFKPGFSTSEMVTTVSGRGVGLAAVHDAVRKAGGKISVETKAGHGTTFRVSLPGDRRKR
jgi:two-component sensor histidine kinase